MPRLTLDINSLKALASETRLDILKALDGKKMSLKEISTTTNLHDVTIHEHLTKLIEGGFVKKHEREGHKWVYYQLSWQGTSLLHPENTKVVLLFSATLLSLFFGIAMFIPLSTRTFTAHMSTSNSGNASGPVPQMIFAVNSSSLLSLVAVLCFVVFLVLLSISIWRYKKNKKQKI